MGQRSIRGSSLWQASSALFVSAATNENDILAIKILGTVDLAGTITVYNGPGAVGKSRPTMTAAIQTITATPSDFSHPM